LRERERREGERKRWRERERAPLRVQVHVGGRWHACVALSSHIMYLLISFRVSLCLAHRMRCQKLV